MFGDDDNFNYTFFSWKLMSRTSVLSVHTSLSVLHCWIPQSAKCVITQELWFVSQGLMTILTLKGPHTPTNRWEDHWDGCLGILQMT